MRDLHVAPNLKLPITATTESFAMVGIRGSGKSTTAKNIVEELTEAQQQCVIMDPTGVWWGLRSHYDFTILGGEHGDISIEPHHGSMIADFVVDHHSSVIVDLSHMRKNEQRRFMLAFAETLYHRNREPLMLVVDECDLYVPQRIPSGQEPLVGAMEDIVRRGRVKGLGIIMISQRPASVNKDVLSQVGTLFVHRLTGAHDRAAIKAWIETQGSEEHAKLLPSLPSLKTGEAWVWSPAWLQILQKTQMRKAISFDSMATPEPGKVKSAKLRPLDIAMLTEALAQVVTESEARDPKVLRAEIQDLERTIRALEHKLAERPADEAIAAAHQDGLAKGFQEGHEYAMRSVRGALVPLLELCEADTPAPEGRVDSFSAPIVSEPLTAENHTALPTTSRPGFKTMPSGRVLTPAAGDTSMTGPQRKLMTALVQYGDMDIKRLAAITGYSNSGGFRNIISQLRTKGWVQGTSQLLQATQQGADALGSYDPLPRGQALLQHWIDQLPGPHGKVLTEVARHGVRGIPIEQLASLTGYTNSGGFRNIVSKLRTLGLVAKGSPIRLTPEFLEAIL